MNFTDLVTRIFGAPPARHPPALKNKPGGLAWIKGLHKHGADAMNGRYVQTLHADREGFWTVDPPQQFVLTEAALDVDGTIGQPGDAVYMVSIHDDHLVPCDDPGADAQDESRAYLPPVPRDEKARAPA